MLPSFRILLACAAIACVPAADALAQRLPNLNPPGAGGNQPTQGGELGPVVGDGKITVQPSMRVGQKMVASFQDFPDPGDSDILVVVAAGAPDGVTPGSQGEKPLAYTYASNRYTLENGWEIGPFAPGRYEVRWLTTLYNNQKKLEVGARAQFSVTR